MSRIPELKELRDTTIRKRYDVLSSKTINNKQVYRHEAILEMMSKEFFLAPDTIGDIVAAGGNDEEPVNPNQTKMEL